MKNQERGRQAGNVVTIESPKLGSAIALMQSGRLAEAEALVRHYLQSHPDDVAAICILGDLAGRAGIHSQAIALFRRATMLAPNFGEAKLNLARVLAQTIHVDDALRILDQLIADEPDNLSANLKRLSLLGELGDFDLAQTGYVALLDKHPDSPRLWLAYGHLLKTIGNAEASTDAFRRALALDPTLGAAWWALANLKFTQFSAGDVSAIEALLAGAPSDQQACELHFTLGRLFEQQRNYQRSFGHYATANRLQCRALRYDRTETSAEVDRSIALFTGSFFDKSRRGTTSTAPIFILGMPRAGSTLIEQILASHPSIEGTSELPIIPMLIHSLMNARWEDRTLTYPGIVEAISQQEAVTLGQRYLAAASLHRKTDRPFFIDKLPNNWLNIGFIKTILPDAKIIDARRSAMACCFSNFKQHFAHGQPFAYSFKDIGAYYRDYVRLMAHFDEILPGTVLRIDHEQLVDDPKRVVRMMLDYLGLPFDPACLRFHENKRPVRTASSEQVRRPISRDAVALWRHYEPWLGDLRDALGSLADDRPFGR